MFSGAYENDNLPRFTSNDLGCCAALVGLGFELAGIDRINPKRVLFVFSDSAQVRDAARQYWNGELALSAKAYFDTIRSLKARLYSGQ
jgi:hypothetical protein